MSAASEILGKSGVVGVACCNVRVKKGRKPEYCRKDTEEAQKHLLGCVQNAILLYAAK